MADNYLERQYDDYLRLKAKKAEEKRRKWQKQLKEYTLKQQNNSLMKKSLLLILAAAISLSASAKLQLHHMLGDHMVLQQNTKVTLSGSAAAKADVTITPSWGAEPVSTKADKNGAWKVDIDTPAGSFTPYSITFASDGDTITLNDVLLGEVWLATGQSNMQMPLCGFGGCMVKGGYDEIANSSDYADMVRFYSVPTTQSYTPVESIDVDWTVPSSKTSPNYSATAWYFAKRVAKVLGVPVGIVNIAYGGSKVESWLPEYIVKDYPDISLDKADMDAMIHYWRPVLMYNAMFYPVKDYAYAGIIWYQGCSNTSSWETYAERLATMVDLWREQIGRGEIPFYEVEIAPFDYDSPIENGRAPFLRAEQWRATELIPNSACIGTNNTVEPYEKHNIHPENKSVIGSRLADMALNRTYGHYEFIAEYPKYESARFADGAAWVKIKSPWGCCRNYDLQGFEVAGADRVFHPATNVWSNWQTDEIVVSCPEVTQPVAVRYCFKDFQPGTYYGANYLPLTPFRSDDWEPDYTTTGK